MLFRWIYAFYQGRLNCAKLEPNIMDACAGIGHMIEQPHWCAGEHLHVILLPDEVFTRWNPLSLKYILILLQNKWK